MILGCIADDHRRHGPCEYVGQGCGSSNDRWPEAGVIADDANAVVVALKSRSTADDAVADSMAALKVLRAAARNSFYSNTVPRLIRRTRATSVRWVTPLRERWRLRPFWFALFPGPGARSIRATCSSVRNSSTKAEWKTLNPIARCESCRFFGRTNGAGVGEASVVIQR